MSPKKHDDKKKHEDKNKKKPHKGSRVVNEKNLSFAELPAILENLLAEIRTGVLKVAEDDKELNITLPADIKLRIKADRNDKEEKYSLQLRWPVNLLASQQPEDTKVE